jgi:hypothetical protein
MGIGLVHVLYKSGGTALRSSPNKAPSSRES